MRKTVTVCLLFFVVFTLSSVALASTGPLAGKVIVLNPGHGGEERGAIGLNGLQEGVINLKVAKYLREMLEAEGATVIMTRESDRNLDPAEIFSGTRDRLLRLEVGAQHHADIFIALHHNSNTRARDNQQIEVYYKSGSYGPSRQLASYVCEGLKKHMGLGGITTTASLTIINHATVPTIIGEASYISNPDIEAWLSKDENLKKEARGYFEGIKKFFAAGMPRVEPVYPRSEQKIIESRPVIKARLAVEPGTSKINPDSVRVLLDKRFIPFEYDPDSGMMTARPGKELATGAHQLLIVAANKAGINAVPADFTFYVDRPAASIELDPYPYTVPARGGVRVKISGRVLDSNGDPVLDGYKLRFRLDGGELARDYVYLDKGRFANYITRPTGADFGISVLKIDAGTVTKEIVIKYAGSKAYLHGQVVEKNTGKPCADAAVELAGPKVIPVRTDREGEFAIPAVPAGTYTLTISKPGLETLRRRLKVDLAGVVSEQYALAPVAGGVLVGKKLALNAFAREGDAEFSREVAAALAEKLKQAGAQVTVVSEVGSAEEALDAVNEAFAELIINIEPADGNEAAVLHFPRREGAKQTARLLAQRLRQGGITATVGESRSQLVIFANAESLVVSLPPGDSEAYGEVLFNWLAEVFGN